METYKYVCEFMLGDTNYVMFMDQNNKRFFLKHMNNTYSYVTGEELFTICSCLHHSEDVFDFDNEKRKPYKMIPKIILGAHAASLIPPILLTSLLYYNQQYRYNRLKKEQYAAYNYNEYLNSEDLTIEFIEKYLSTAEKYYTDGAKVDTYLRSDMFRYTYIYDMDYLNLVYDKKSITFEDLDKVIDANGNIPDRFKDLIREYSHQLCTKYNNIELRVFYENLKTLKVIECDENELLLHTLSTTSSGCYVRTENTIYVPKGYFYERGTWEYQVIFHELSHCARTRMITDGSDDVRIQFQGINYFNTVTEEALNSLFAVSLLDYEEKDYAYQLQSNYYSVIIECLDNYDLSDYMNHSLTYLVSKLDEQNKDKEKAVVIMELIEMQYDDYHKQDITISQDQFYRIYDYISEMYYDKYLHEGMSYDEMKAIADELVNRVTYDVPAGYSIDVNHFYDYFDNYVTEHNYASARGK